MDTTPEQINQAKKVLDDAKEILIALPVGSDYDRIAGALSLYLALLKKGKNVSIVSPDEITVEYNQLIAIDKVSNNFSTGANGNNLVVSFPYQEGSIEKVSYNIENDLFNLVIEPRENYPVITPDMIKYSFSGGNCDTVVTIGASALPNLGAIYENNPDFFNQKNILNIDINPLNSKFGKFNIINENASSMSEHILALFDSFELLKDQDISTNLLAGITMATNSFTSPKTNAYTFEAAAICLKNGARKIEVNNQSVQNIPQQTVQQPPRIPNFQKPRPFQPPGQQNYQSGSRQYQKQPQQFFNKPKSLPQQNFQQQPAYKPQVPGNFTPNNPYQQTNVTQNQQAGQNKQTQNISHEAPETAHQTQPKNITDAPADWLKPKIYKGSTLL